MKRKMQDVSINGLNLLLMDSIKPLAKPVFSQLHPTAFPVFGAETSF